MDQILIDISSFCVTMLQQYTTYSIHPDGSSLRSGLPLLFLALNMICILLDWRSVAMLDRVPEILPLIEQIRSMHADHTAFCHESSKVIINALSATFCVSSLVANAWTNREPKDADALKHCKGLSLEQDQIKAIRFVHHFTLRSIFEPLRHFSLWCHQRQYQSNRLPEQKSLKDTLQPTGQNGTTPKPNN